MNASTTNPQPNPNFERYQTILRRLRLRDCFDREPVDPSKDNPARCPAHDDERPSLSIKLTDDGRILLQCFAGCSIEQILAALRLTKADLIPPPVIYQYIDLDGNIRHETVREYPKKFRQRRPDPENEGEYIWSLKGIDLVLYNLPGIQNQPDVYFTEGEKDANNLIALGLPATTAAMGAGSWSEKYVVQFQEAGVERITIIPDNDDPGRAYAVAIARSCMTAGLRVRIVQLPELKEKGDVSDWLNTKTKDNLVALIENTPELADVPEMPVVTTIPYTGMANAARFVSRHGQNVRYVDAWEHWLIWDGKRWKPDDRQQIMELAKTVAREMFNEALAASDKFGLAWASKTASAGRLNEMLTLAASDPLIAATPDQFDAEPYILNTPSGTVDVRTGEMWPHRQTDMLSKMTAATYEPTATSPLWDRFIQRVLPGIKLREYFWKVMGSSLAGDPIDQKFPFVLGPPATGKSTVLNAIREALGTYATTCDPETLLKKSYSGGPRNDLADLAGLRLVTSVEPQDGRGWDAQRIQQLTGGDPVKARRLYENDVQYQPKFLLVVGANTKPFVPATNGAFWRRLRVIDFNQEIPPGDRDRMLPRKLAEPGTQRAILAWLVAGCRAWAAEPVLVEPEQVMEATTEYQMENDPIRQWADECLTFGPREKATAADLWASYCRWCSSNAEETVKPGKPWARALERLGIKKESQAYRSYVNASVKPS